MTKLRANNLLQERKRGQRRHPPYTPYSIGNSSRVIFRIGIKLPRALLGCFLEVRMAKRRAKHVGRKALRAFLNIEAKWTGAHLGKENRWTF